jgi:TolB-like protein
MSGQQRGLTQFWQELKRRRVIHVIMVYATAAFVIIELINNVTEPLNLPEWTPTLVIIILLVGFPLAVILSWIFDVTPEGIEKTKPIQEIKDREKPLVPNSWRIATIVSVVIIIGLLVFNIFGSRNEAKIDDSLEKSIAVLPFLNLVGDPNQEYICVGLTDEIISHLYKVKSFDEVRSLTSVLNYMDSEKSTTEIAEELRVNYILEGSYKRIGDELRITAQLIDKSDKHIWLQNYDRPYKEIIAIPADIALQIADQLKAYITGSEKQNIQKIPTANQEAYELILQIEYILNTRGFGPTSETLDLALEAIRLDPNYADAYAWAGSITLWKGIYTGDMDMQYAAMDALPFFEKALELDQNNSHAHLGIGYVNELARWDYIKAKQGYLKAIELEPKNPYLYDGIVEFFLKMCQLEDVMIQIEKSQVEDEFLSYMIRSHILSGNKNEAYDLLPQALNDEFRHPYKGELYLWIEEHDSARYYLESALQSEHYEMTIPRFQACLALAYHKTKDYEQAQLVISQLIEKSDTTSAGSPAFFIGWYYSWIEEMDSAFYWLEKAYINRSPEMPWLKVDPAFNSLKEDPRYWDLYERTGHKAYDDYMASKKK